MTVTRTAIRLTITRGPIEIKPSMPRRGAYEIRTTENVSPRFPISDVDIVADSGVRAGHGYSFSVKKVTKDSC